MWFNHAKTSILLGYRDFIRVLSPDWLYVITSEIVKALRFKTDSLIAELETLETVEELYKAQSLFTLTRFLNSLYFVLYQHKYILLNQSVNDLKHSESCNYTSIL